jgi:protein-disulfide isomerase
LNHRLHISKAAKSRHGCASWLSAASVLAALAIFGLSVASAADPQTTQHHASISTPAKTAVDSAAPVKAYGSSNAPITMEVFSDYECPSCRNLFEQTLRPLITGYVADGKVYLVHRDFPLPMHKYGYEAARWLNASARAGQFPAVEAALYDNQNSWAVDGNIAKYVSAAMSPEAFKRVQTLMHGCADPTAAGVKTASFSLANQASQSCALDSYIELDRALGNKIPVQATPTFVITYKGQHLPAGAGFVSYPILKQFFDSLLSQ